ncbi:glycoprotein precursor [Mammarenavirus cupixiense]|uniref:Pre-glycoprotein polyprotein GP complex n=1 Tax=Cupixi mammarenavirus (isolate Rat/Brasil/BeAn 119303/1970) TaxID=3052304 RepID=GLYC_CPXVB|nr:glycoprotein precursor [Mammarenavirus cupixiense]Q8B115.1 RecName: Full=Pre-glycoprotein polyprotein GP complex; Short=Pre-GP-C; Contains: RecName: Full=Stable signal peptide; Short=SSP; Contains: RecName: Full=Glycoprotein G1; Short=GP1; Contains: RecName: Full=Glycoprotein G2; Short=GP2 [Mammarenavirus cupixiense]AAN32963.1 glycoprotein precursor [Mammarenavirus cupixiense]
MGQLVSFFQEIPVFFQEALNIALAVVTLLAIVKGVLNLWKSGLFQLLMFLILAGRSCSFRIGYHTSFESFTMTIGGVFHELPALCKVNDTYNLVRLSHNSSLALSVEYGDTGTVMCEHGHVVSGNYTECTGASEEYNWVLDWVLRGLQHDFSRDPVICCEPKKKTNAEFQFRLNLTQRHKGDHYQNKIKTALTHLFGPFAYNEKDPKIFVTMRNTTWTNQCVMSHTDSLRLLASNGGNSFSGRGLKAFFSWSLSDSTGVDMPGGYCLEKWMLIASELKCFGNTALAKCNLKHDSEFCDMIKLFDFNKNAISKLNNNTIEAVNQLTKTVNSLISDNLLMKNRLRELLKVPYCNYTRFWYVNHTRTGEHSLPKCWLVNNGSYLNESDFRNEWILESDHLISEMLSKEYQERQGRTPLTLVDLCFWSAVFYTTTLFLHLVGFPTHRHISGEPCPLPHRLNRHGACNCGRFKRLKKPLVWYKHH